MDQLDGKGAVPRTKAVSPVESTYDCDVCGKAFNGAEHLAALRGVVMMCRSCGLNVGSLPGSLHRAASRFLMGNVL